MRRFPFCLLLIVIIAINCGQPAFHPDYAFNIQQAAVSPDGSRIAFVLFDGIWVMPSHGGTATQLTAGAQLDNSPRWVPGPEPRISYRSNRGNTGGLYMVNPETGEDSQVPQIPRNIGAYDWLPNGELVYAVGSRIFQRNPNNGHSRIVVEEAPGAPMSIRSAPDGKMFAYDARYFVGYQERLGEMHCVSLTDDRAVLITGRAKEHFSPAWSPDGNALAYTNYEKGTEDIYICAFDRQTMQAGEPRQITTDHREETMPNWMPDGESLVVQANRHGQSALFRVPVDGGEMTPIPVTGLKFREPTGRLLVTVLDNANNEPTPARVYLRTADGRAYYPPGSYPRRNLKGDRSDFFHTDGHFEIELPAGEVTLEVTRGFEYGLESQKVTVIPGGTVHEIFGLKRWIDMGDRGWYSADNHFHANYGGPFFMEPDHVKLMLEAEDLNIGNLVSGNSWAARLYDREFFSGGLHPLSTDRYLLRWNQEYRATVFGHLILMNLDEMVAPYLAGFTLSDNVEDYPPNLDVIRAAQQKGGTAHYTHPQNSSDPFAGDYNAYELPVDLVLGRLDAMDIACYWSDERSSAGLYYRLLNCGFRMAASAGTDVFTSRINPPPGGERVYVHAGSPLTWENWIGAFKAGKTFVTNGPMLTFTVDGKESGSEINFDGNGPHSVHVQTSVESQVPVERLEILRNGQVVETLEVNGDNAEIDVNIPVDQSCWIAVRALGPGHQLVMDTYAFAHTTPVYVTVNGARVSSQDDARFFVTWIDEVLRRLDERDRWTRPEHKQRIHEIFQEAREFYQQMAGQPTA